MTAIVVDTSAIVASLRNEPEKDRFVDVLLAASPRLMSAVSLQEAGMVIAGRSGDHAAWEPLDALLARLDVEIVAHDETLARIAREAFIRFGKGRHAARLSRISRSAGHADRRSTGRVRSARPRGETGASVPHLSCASTRLVIARSQASKPLDYRYV